MHHAIGYASPAECTCNKFTLIIIIIIIIITATTTTTIVLQRREH